MTIRVPRVDRWTRARRPGATSPASGCTTAAAASADARPARARAPRPSPASGGAPATRRASSTSPSASTSRSEQPGPSVPLEARAGPPYTTFPGVGQLVRGRAGARALLERRRTGGFHADVDFGRARRPAADERHPRAPGASRRGSSPPASTCRRACQGGVPRVRRAAPALPRSRSRRLDDRGSVPRASPSRSTRSAAPTRSTRSSRRNQLASSATSATTSWPPRSGAGPTAGTPTRRRRTSSRSGRRGAPLRARPRSRSHSAATRWAATAPTSSASSTRTCSARAFTTVGPPARGIWVPPAPPQPGGEDSNSNPRPARERALDPVHELGRAERTSSCPTSGPRASSSRFDELGLRSSSGRFPGDHFTLAIARRVGRRRATSSATRRVTRDPSRVDYAFFPAADRPALGPRARPRLLGLGPARPRRRTAIRRRIPPAAEIDALSAGVRRGRRRGRSRSPGSAAPRTGGRRRA